MTLRRDLPDGSPSLQDFRWEIYRWLDNTRSMIMTRPAVRPEQQDDWQQVNRAGKAVKAILLRDGPLDGIAGTATKCEDWLTPHRLDIADDFDLGVRGHYRRTTTDWIQHQFHYKWIGDPA